MRDCSIWPYNSQRENMCFRIPGPVLLFILHVSIYLFLVFFSGILKALYIFQIVFHFLFVNTCISFSNNSTESRLKKTNFKQMEYTTFLKYEYLSHAVLFYSVNAFVAVQIV